MAERLASSEMQTVPRSESANASAHVGMAARIAALDWSKTGLGPRASWPANLKAAVGLILPAQAEIVLFWGAQFIAIYNDAYAPTIGEKHPRALGRSARENWEELWDDLEPLLRSVRETGETVVAKDRPFYIERHGYPETVYFDISYSPVRGDDESIDGVLCIVAETTSRVVAQRELARAQERLTQALSAGGMVGTFDWYIATDTFYSDAYFAEKFSVAPEKGEQGAPLSEYLASVHPDDVDRIQAAVDRTLATGERYAQQYRLLRGDGAVAWVDARGECLRDAYGEPSRFVGVVVDITSSRELQERQQLLLQEMNHRVKNLLAVFRGLIALSARSARSPQDMGESLTGRLDALTQAKELVRPALMGAENAQGEQTNVETLARTVLAPYDGSQTRFVVRGPDVPVGPKAVTSLALALHEIATNAAKYGALSSADGDVRIVWDVRGDLLHLDWEESGGPAIDAPPQAAGFGSALTRRSITGQLGGAIRYDWRRAGLKIEITIAVQALAE